MNIDIHAHMLVSELLVQHGPEPWRPEIVQLPEGGCLARNNDFVNGPTFRPLVEPGEIVEALEAAGIDLAVLSTPPYSFFYELPVPEGEYASQIQNDGFARAASDHPQRLAGLGTLPLQNVSRSVKELYRVMTELKLAGVEIASHVNGENLSHARFRPFWEAAEALGAIVFVHPAYSCQVGTERLGDYYLRNLLGNPMETAVFAANVIFSGLLDDYPRLKIVLAHAGGVLPYLRGRLEHGYQVRPEPKRHISKEPSVYLGMLYYDIITHYEPTLQYLVGMVGADHVLLGSDYPYDMGYDDPVKVVNDCPWLSKIDREKILGGNAARLMNGSK